MVRSAAALSVVRSRRRALDRMARRPGPHAPPGDGPHLGLLMNAPIDRRRVSGISRKDRRRCGRARCCPNTARGSSLSLFCARSASDPKLTNAVLLPPDSTLLAVASLADLYSVPWTLP